MLIIMGDLVASIFRNKEVILLACRMPKHIQAKLMLSAVAAITNNYDTSNEVQAFCEMSGLSAEDVLQLLGLYISLVRLYMETDGKQFVEILLTAGFSDPFIDNFPLKHKMQPSSKEAGSTNSNN